MTTCNHRQRLQDFLDGELPESQAVAFADHLESCDSCASDLAWFERADKMIAEAPIWDPGVAFTERVLDRVVPSRARARLVTVVGWTYTAVSAVSTYLLISWLTRPSTPGWIADQMSEIYLASLRGGLFAIQTVVTGILRVGDGAELLHSFRDLVAPLVHAVALTLSNPVMAALVASAVATTVATLWWMRPRAASVGVQRRSRGGDHVGLLGF